MAFRQSKVILVMATRRDTPLQSRTGSEGRTVLCTLGRGTCLGAEVAPDLSPEVAPDLSPHPMQPVHPMRFHHFHRLHRLHRLRGRGHSHLMPGANEVRMEVAARATMHRLLGMDLVTLGKHPAEPVRREPLTYRAFFTPDARVSDH
jgi:hypothetical protein